MVEQHPVVQGLVAVVQGLQEDVPLQVVLLAVEVLHRPAHLVVDAHHLVRDHAADTQGVPLAVREPGPLVQHRIGQELLAALGDGKDRVVQGIDRDGA